MLDAIRIAGRWVANEVLTRVSALSRSKKPPVRAQVVREFCRWTNWHNRKGEPCYASANVALNRLEEQGLVELPDPAPRAAPTQPRRLVDDQEPLPKVPRLGAGIPALTLQLIQGPKDPDYRLWNRLIIREHPLKGAPMVGAQLRYLLRSPEGVLGALGVGPAAYHLECRDLWIGWDRPTRQGNLSLVIGLPRFVIRRGVSSPNLASRAYRLLLERVPGDWQERHGLKPVLIETFVDRSTQTGTSLSAANWRRLGQSRGHGRSNPKGKPSAKNAKDVWVYELEPKARQRLLSAPVPLIVPRSLFQGIDSDVWAQEELDGLELGDVRWEKRFALMLESRWKNPQYSFYRSFGGKAAGKAAYRLIESPQAEISFESLLAPHAQQTQRRMAAESLVVLPQDTTALSYNSLHATTGLGPVGDNDNPGRGLWLHSLQAFRADGIPLGCAWAKLWAREKTESNTAQRNEQSIDEKESVRWLEAYQAARRMALAMPQTHLLIAGDRESDIFELSDQTEAAPPNLHLLMRAQHDRMLTDGQKLWDRLLQEPVRGTMQVQVPRREKRPARVATLEIRWASIEAAPPRVALKKSWQPVPLYAVMAREIDPPAGQEAIEWVLLTDWKVDSLKMAVRVIEWYALRWGIECWHQTLKDVCKIETRQMESAKALARALVLDMIVAWRALLACRLGKKHPTLPACLFYGEDELVVLEAYKDDLPQYALAEVLSTAADLTQAKEGEAPSESCASDKGNDQATSPPVHSSILKEISSPATPLLPAPEPEALSEPCAGDQGAVQETPSPVHRATLTEDNSLPAQPPQEQAPQAPSKKRACDPGKPQRTPPSSSRPGLSLYQANLLVAMLAGFWGRKSDGHPGPKLLAQGLIALATMVRLYRKVIKQAPSPPPPKPKRPRKPG